MIECVCVCVFVCERERERELLIETTIDLSSFTALINFVAKTFLTKTSYVIFFTVTHNILFLAVVT